LEDAFLKTEKLEHTAQILLTHDDLSNRERYLNARSTLRTLLEKNVIPIVNENDTIAIDEITQLVNSKDERFRLFGTLALAETGDPGALQRIIAKLKKELQHIEKHRKR